jgi:hypothetical protein
MCRAFGREHCAEGATYTRFADNLELGLMSRENVFYDCKSKAGSASFAATTTINPIETLCESVYMLLRDSYSVIAYTKYRQIVAQLPDNFNLPTLMCVAYGIADQIAKRAL